MSVVITLLIICLVTVVHEYGHFIAARLNGVRVLEFAIGMGPKLCGYESKKSGTVFSLRLFPIGGSCQMLGENEEDDAGDAFNNKPVWRRMTIILAGVFMNVVLGVVISFCYLMGNFYLEPVVSQVFEGTPAMAAGLKPGDRINKINGKSMHLFDDVKMYLTLNADGRELAFEVERGGEKIEKAITPEMVYDGAGRGEYRIGIGAGAYVFGPFFGGERAGREANIGEITVMSWHTTVGYVKSVVSGLGGMISGKISTREAAGPIYMGKIIDDTNNQIMASESVDNKPLAIFWTMLQFAAIISANLAVINLLPIPALDGGRFVILAIDGIIRKPLNQNAVGVLTFVSFALVMLLAAAVAFSDILKLIA